MLLSVDSKKRLPENPILANGGVDRTCKTDWTCKTRHKQDSRTGGENAELEGSNFTRRLAVVRRPSAHFSRTVDQTPQDLHSQESFEEYIDFYVLSFSLSLSP